MIKRFLAYIGTIFVLLLMLICGAVLAVTVAETILPADKVCFESNKIEMLVTEEPTEYTLYRVWEK